jgi:hypothetical protein
VKAYVAWTQTDAGVILVSIPALGIVTEAENAEQVLAIAKDAVGGFLATAAAHGVTVPPATIEASDSVVLAAVSDIVRWGDPIVFQPDEAAAA